MVYKNYLLACLGLFLVTRTQPMEQPNASSASVESKDVDQQERHRSNEINVLGIVLLEAIVKGDFRALQTVMENLKELKWIVGRLRDKHSEMTLLHIAIKCRKADFNFRDSYAPPTSYFDLPAFCSSDKPTCIVDALLPLSDRKAKDRSGRIPLHYLIDDMQSEEDLVFADYLTEFPYHFREYLAIANNKQITLLQELEERAKTNTYNQRLLELYRKKLEEHDDTQNERSRMEWCITS